MGVSLMGGGKDGLVVWIDGWKGGCKSWELMG